MPFIPNKASVGFGSRVILLEDVKVLAGVFTRGTELTIVGVSERGYNLKDDHGNELLEYGAIDGVNWEVVRY